MRRCRGQAACWAAEESLFGLTRPTRSDSAFLSLHSQGGDGEGGAGERTLDGNPSWRRGAAGTIALCGWSGKVVAQDTSPTHIPRPSVGSGSHAYAAFRMARFECSGKTDGRSREWTQGTPCRQEPSQSSTKRRQRGDRSQCSSLSGSNVHASFLLSQAPASSALT
jgi:hypothetical protein